MLKCKFLARAFSLIELLICLAIVAILVGLATPPMTGLIDSMTLSSHSNKFLSALNFARSEAIKRNGRVVLCKSISGVSCTAEGNWDQGWIVFHDSNNNAVLDVSESILRRDSSLPKRIKMFGNTPVAKYISYTATGVTKLNSGAFQAGTITLCSESSSSMDARLIILSSTGRARVEKTRLNLCVA